MNQPQILPTNLLPPDPFAPAAPAVPTMRLTAPDLDETPDDELREHLAAEEARETAAPSQRRETARRAATQLVWRGKPILWTCGRLALFQALGEATGADSIPSFVPNRRWLDAILFGFLAIHEETVWERARTISFDGKNLTLPPLQNDFIHFATVIRAWSDREIGADADALESLSQLKDQTLNLHNSTRAVPDPDELAKLGEIENFPPGQPGKPNSLSESPALPKDGPEISSDGISPW